MVGALQAKAIVEGPNFFFGHNRQGTIETLGQFATEAHIALEVVPPVEIDGEMVSSSRVRKLIAAGRIEEACHLLTRPYRIRGMVTHGAGRGAKLGFPTANVDAIDTLLPGRGRVCRPGDHDQWHHGRPRSTSAPTRRSANTP